MSQKLSLTSNTPIDAEDAGQPVVAKVPQGYETRINIRLLSGRDFDLSAVQLGCRPRRGASRREAEPVPLPPDLAGRLREANDKVVAWLNADPANAQLFLGKPVEALMKAGVELSRAEQKMIHRTQRENAEVSVIGPGVKIHELNVVGRPLGRVGGLKTGPARGSREVSGFTKKGEE